VQQKNYGGKKRAYSGATLVLTFGETDPMINVK